MTMRFLLALTLLHLSACSVLQPGGRAAVEPARTWREVATPTERERLRDWRDAFEQALAAARQGGHAADLARDGALLDPDAAIGGQIPNGRYRCRVIKLGAKSEGMLDYVAYPYFTCEIRAGNGVQHFTKLTGSQRQVGIIYPGDAMRQVFLGTLVLGDEPRALQYGIDETRDVAGYVERIGPARWRLLMPRPHFESQTDVMELVPLAGGAR